MKTPAIALIAGVLAAGLVARAQVPAFSTMDRFATGPTMLVRMGQDGAVREIWSGMDRQRMRHVPLFLETAIHAEVRLAGKWTDLRSLHFRDGGTRPGAVHLVSDDGFVSIDATSCRRAEAAPMFVRYRFREPSDVRIETRFARSDLTQAFRSNDAAGWVQFSTLWRDTNSEPSSQKGPELYLATDPCGRTLSLDKEGAVKEIDAAREVLLCLDATERPVNADASVPFVRNWVETLHGTKDDPSAEVRVRVSTGDAALDRMFSSSIDAVSASQFASGDVMADLFFYRDSWLRDGTYSMIGLALGGDPAQVEKYFSFWTPQRDFSVGGEREAQQPSIAIAGMWFYSRLCASPEAFLKKGWPYVSYYSDYYCDRIEKEGLLHVAEEWICFIPAPSTWPNAEIHGGLRAAAKIARALGHSQEAARWDATADKLQKAFLESAYDAAKGRIIPMAGPAGATFTDPDYPKAESRNGPLRDERVDAGMLIIGRGDVLGRSQGIISVDDPRFASTQAQIMRDLENPDHSIFRFGPNPSSPHAPAGELDTWPIIMGWAAQDQWLLGNTDLAWRYLISGIVNKKGYDRDAMDDYLPENWDRKGYADKPMITWSHGEFVTSTLLLLTGFNLEPEKGDLGLAPSLPPGTRHATVRNFRFRDQMLDLDLSREDNKIAVRVDAHGDGALDLLTPDGVLVRASQGTPARFTVDPSLYYRTFGHSRNAADRAAIFARTLGGADPEKLPQDPQALQDLLVRIQTDFAPTAR